MVLPKEEVQLVKDIINQHLGHYRYKNQMYPSDIAFNKTVLNNETLLPELLSMKNVELLFSEMPNKPTFVYVNKFRGEAILYCMGASMAAARNKVEFKMPSVGFIARRLQEKWAAV